MKKAIMIAALMLGIAAAGLAQEQKPTVVELDQTPGKFEKEGLTLTAGKYVFEVSNVGVEKEVGFVIVPVVNGQEGAHIVEGYLSKTIKDGEKASSKVVDLKPGIYAYFCPLNPTPHYTITVK